MTDVWTRYTALKDERRFKIEQTARLLATQIRDYVKLQLKDWQRVPWLALQADGRGGYSDDLRKAYKFGLWPIQSGQGGQTLFIDCMTTEIVRNIGELADDAGVIGSAHRLELLDAAKIIHTLEHNAKHGDPGHMTKSELDERARWRENLVREYDLSPERYAPANRKKIVWSFGDY